MGLYESELNKQIHLRSRQKKEWGKMKQKIEADIEKNNQEISEQQRRDEQEKIDDDRMELVATTTSKKLTASMVRSAQEKGDDTLLKAVEVLRDQNGTNTACC